MHYEQKYIEHNMSNMVKHVMGKHLDWCDWDGMQLERVLRNQVVINERLLRNRRMLEIRLRNRLKYEDVKQVVDPERVDFSLIHRIIDPIYKNRRDKSLCISERIKRAGKKIEHGIKRKILLWRMRYGNDPFR
ncbi:hypothetical protein ECANGB1_2071 [Enterospora canceri]|uniref:Uncharacterized protein n=1 Tax=Enterospora canceri TaxID=1081671 RepID=A0A1Y1S8T9_9MICR|nr:hypothetical protein ECANGB1_2071 [Enterospora canceri]